MPFYIELLFLGRHPGTLGLPFLVSLRFTSSGTLKSRTFRFNVPLLITMVTSRNLSFALPSLEFA